MPQYGIKINEAQISEKINKAIRKKGLPVAQKKAYNLFKRSHNALLKEFDEHNITNELLAGANAVPLTSATNGYGNLYAFLGFTHNPIPDLRAILVKGFSFRYTTHRNNSYYFKVSTPNKGVIDFVTPLPWGTGDSWVESIEGGLDNLAFFMYKKKFGRSKAGFQAPYEINDDLSFTKQKYLSEILGNFRNRINQSSINNIWLYNLKIE